MKCGERSIKAVLWDFDGTIVDTINLVCFALKQSFLYADGRVLRESEFNSMFGPPEDEIIRRHFQNTACIPYGIELYHALYEQCHENFVVYHRRIKHLLATLSQQEIQQAIVTGKGRRSLALSLEKLQITGFFSAAVTGNDTTAPKPDPESLVVALQNLGVAPRNAVMVGDSEADYLAARAIGMDCIIVGWYRTPLFNGEYEFCHDIHSFSRKFIRQNHCLPDLL